MRDDLSREELGQLDYDGWMAETTVIREWVAFGGVDTLALARELRQWAAYFTPTGEVLSVPHPLNVSLEQTPDQMKERLRSLTGFDVT